MSYTKPTIPPETAAKVEETKEAIAQVVTDVSQGKPPTSANLASVISDARDVIHQQKSDENLSHYGARIVEDVDKVLGDTQRFLQEKNKGDHLQKIISGVQKASEAQQSKSDEFYQKSKGFAHQYQGDLQNTGEYLRSVTLQLVQSPEFRGVLLEFIELIRSSFIMVAKEKHMENPVTHQLESEVKGKETRPLKHTMEDTGKDIENFAKDVVEDVKEGTLPVDPKHRDALYSQWEALLRKIAHNPDFHHAAKGLLSIAKHFSYSFQLEPSKKGTKATTTASTGSVMEEMTSEVLSDTAREEMERVWTESGKFVSEFAGQENVEAFSKALKKLIHSVKDDPQLSKYMRELHDYVLDLLEAPQRLDDKDFRTRGETLLKEGKEISSKWSKRRSLKHFSRKAEKLMKAIKNDPLSNKVVIDTKRLGEHLLLDDQGKPSLAVTQEAVQGLSTILLPVVSEMLKSLPLPTLEGSNDTYDWSLDKILLTSPQSLLPENFVMFFRSKMNMKAPTPSTAPIQARIQAPSVSSQAEVVLRVQGFEIFLNDLHFYFKRKEFPKLEDTGVADISLTGAYNFLEVIWQMDQEQGLVLVDVRCVFDELEFNIKQAQHNILLPLITKLFKGTIKRKVEVFVEDSLTTAVMNLNSQLNQAVSNAQKATASVISSSFAKSESQPQSSLFLPSAVNPSK